MSSTVPHIAKDILCNPTQARIDQHCGILSSQEATSDPGSPAAVGASEHLGLEVGCLNNTYFEELL